MTRLLRDYQVDAILAIREEWAKGIIRTGAVLATGLGKTDIIGYLNGDTVERGQKTLNLAHRSELLDQIIERSRIWLRERDIRKANGQLPSVGRVQGQINETRRDIIAGSVKTVCKPARQQLMIKPDEVIIDEGHHAASDGYRDTMNWAGSFRDQIPELGPNGELLPPVRTLGVTATMVRGDKRSLGDVWQSIAIERGIQWGVEWGPSGRIVEGALGPMYESHHIGDAGTGWLVRPFGRCVVTDHMELEKAKIRQGDFTKGELGGMVEQDVEQIVTAWLEHASDRVTMAFTPTIAAATALRDAFLARDVKTEIVLGTTPDGERRAVKERMETGVTRVRVDVGVGTEGFDCPAISCILMARPTRLPGFYAQMVGRGLRPFAGNDHLPAKHDCMVLDVVGASRYVKLQTLVDLLPSSAKDYDRSEVEAIPCPDCGMVGRCPCEVDEPRAKAKLIHAEYEDIELFAASPVRWLATPGGTRFIKAGDWLVHLDPEPGGGWTVAQCRAAGDQHMGSYRAHRLTLEQASAMAEKLAEHFDPKIRTPYKGDGRATSAAIAYAKAYGIEGAERMTGRACSDAISIAQAAKRLD